MKLLELIKLKLMLLYCYRGQEIASLFIPLLSLTNYAADSYATRLIAGCFIALEKGVTEIGHEVSRS